MNLLKNSSPISEHPPNINVILKNHQLSMLQRCKDIENMDKNNFGIMSDRPGAGKTYVILSLINSTLILKKTNIIVVPQNIYKQWILSIEKFSSNITFKKFIDYNHIITLYTDPKILTENDIILTTSSYYHIIATTLTSLNINIDRIFFDEIDSISNIICTNIKSNFIWFVSASFNKDQVGCFGNILPSNIDNITCKCEDNFIDENIYLEQPIKKYYLCKNIYIDFILSNAISSKELKGLNAMDYTLYNNQFNNSKAINERGVIDLILQNRKSIISFDKNQIIEANEKIDFFTNFKENKDSYINTLKEHMDKINMLTDFKNDIINFIDNFNENTEFYLKDIFLNDKNDIKILIELRKDELKILRSMLEDLNEVLYNINKVMIKESIIHLKRSVIIINNIYETILKIKIVNEENIKDFYDKICATKTYLNNLLESLSNNDNVEISENQLSVYNKIVEICKKNIENNENKINLIYNRLKDNNCCPICYEEFDSKNLLNKKIYVTAHCCNNKICETCIDGWYVKMGKHNCIFCNTDNVNFDSLLYFIKDKDIHEDNIKKESNNNLILYGSNKNHFLKEFIISVKEEDKKIIIFSDYPHIFHYIVNLCEENEINYVDLDKGNIKEIDYCINEYKYGNAKILLSNSTLFGCGMNLENSTDILFIHKMDESIEQQVIGRAQRIGRKTVLNIIYLEYENESKYTEKKILGHNFFNVTEYDKNDELEGYYNEQQYYNLIESIQHLNVQFNEEDLPIYDIPDSNVDINLDELISTLF